MYKVLYRICVYGVSWRVYSSVILIEGLCILYMFFGFASWILPALVLWVWPLAQSMFFDKGFARLAYIASLCVGLVMLAFSLHSVDSILLALFCVVLALAKCGLHEDQLKEWEYILTFNPMGIPMRLYIFERLIHWLLLPVPLVLGIAYLGPAGDLLVSLILLSVMYLGAFVLKMKEDCVRLQCALSVGSAGSS